PHVVGDSIMNPTSTHTPAMSSIHSIPPSPPRPPLFPYTTLFRSLPAFRHNDWLSRSLHVVHYSQASRLKNARLHLLHGVLFVSRSEEHTSELQSLRHLVCRLLLEKKKNVFLASGPTREFAMLG